MSGSDPDSESLSGGDLTLEADSEFRRVLHGVAAVPDGTLVLERGEMIGELRIEERLGAGGMGVVYRATDTRLDRQVAVKLHRGAAEELTIARLVHEAATMAQVNHPNIVTVYDVGRHYDSMYIAMELVDGGSLTRWLAKNKPGWAAILAAFLQAGEGLAAAHEHGLIHRDFKPDNTLIDATGRVVVADFGLAMSSGGISLDEEESLRISAELGEAISSAHAAVRLTRSGGLMGTPAYMAPEQYGLEELTPAADQFAFCVSLYEALYGRRPFEGKTMAELAWATARGDVRPPPPSEVPSWIFDALRRGLAADPADRYPTMKELLDALRGGQRRRRRRWLAVGAAVALAVGLGAWARAGGDAPLCKGGQATMDAVWGDPQRTELRDAFAGHPEELATVESGLDAYARDWVTQYGTNCEATHVAGRQSEADLDLRTACLSQRIDALEATVDVLLDPKGDTIAHGAEIVGKLPSLESCADLDGLREAIPPPEDPELAEQVRVARRELAGLDALLAAGRIPAAADRIAALEPWVPDVDYPPVQVELLRARARVLKSQREFIRAAETYEAGTWLAMEIGYRRQIPELALQAAFLFAQQMGDEDKAEQLIRVAESNVMHATALEVPAHIEHFKGMMALRHHDAQAASEHFARQLELAEAVMPAGDPAIIDALSNVAIAYDQLGRFVEARAAFERARTLEIEIHGPMHPQVANHERRLGVHFAMQHQPEQSLPHFERALEIIEATTGKDSLSTAAALRDLLRTHRELGNHDEAEAMVQRALQIMEAHDATDTIDYADTVMLATSSQPTTADCEAVLPRLQRAQQAAERIEGIDSRVSLTAMAKIAGCYSVLGRHDDAVRLMKQAVTIDITYRGAVFVDYAIVLHYANRDEEALAVIADGLVAAEEDGDPTAAVALLTQRASSLEALGRFDEALQSADEAMAKALGQDLGNEDIALGLVDVAELYARRGREADAHRLASMVHERYPTTAGRERSRRIGDRAAALLGL